MNQYKVVMEVDPRYTQDISALEKMFVINNEGKAIPLSYFAKWQPADAPLSVNHQGLSAASTISFNLPTGKSLSDASAAIDTRNDPAWGAFDGARQFCRHGAGVPGDDELAGDPDYRRHRHGVYRAGYPLRELRTSADDPLHPASAGVGALLALELFNAPFSLIALIGIMLLIGIVKKNAIMMVDFAL